MRGLGRKRLVVPGVVEPVEERVEFRHARLLPWRRPLGCVTGGLVPVLILGRCRAEGRIHLGREVDHRLAADVDADITAQELPHVAHRLVRARIGTPSRKRQRALEEALQTIRKCGAAPNLRDFDHFHEERRQLFGIFPGLQVPAEYQRESAERHLGDISRGIEVHETIAGRRRDPILGPEPLSREAQALDCRSKDRVEKHDLAIRRQDGARGVDEAVRDAVGRVQQRQRRQRVEQVAQSDVDAGNDSGVSGGFEQVREAAAGDELGQDRELSGGWVALHPRRAGETLVLEDRQPRDARLDERFERGQVRLEMDALEHLARLAVERERPPPQAIDVTGGRDRRRREIR